MRRRAVRHPPQGIGLPHRAWSQVIRQRRHMRRHQPRCVRRALGTRHCNRDVFLRLHTGPRRPRQAEGPRRRGIFLGGIRCVDARQRAFRRAHLAPASQRHEGPVGIDHPPPVIGHGHRGVGGFSQPRRQPLAQHPPAQIKPHDTTEDARHHQQAKRTETTENVKRHLPQRAGLRQRDADRHQRHPAQHQPQPAPRRPRSRVRILRRRLKHRNTRLAGLRRCGSRRVTGRLRTILRHGTISSDAGPACFSRLGCLSRLGCVRRIGCVGGCGCGVCRACHSWPPHGSPERSLPASGAGGCAPS